MKVGEKLSKGWGGENAYHVGGYRYLLVDGDRQISRASPPGKVTTLTKVKCSLTIIKFSLDNHYVFYFLSLKIKFINITSTRVTLFCHLLFTKGFKLFLFLRWNTFVKHTTGT